MNSEKATEEIRSKLDEREKKILIKRFGFVPNTEPMTLEETGRTFGVTPERIRQIQNIALSKVRMALRANGIEYALDEEGNQMYIEFLRKALV